jgi:hypothetical protein
MVEAEDAGPIAGARRREAFARGRPRAVGWKGLPGSPIGPPWIPVSPGGFCGSPPFLEATVDPGEFRDHSGSLKPLEALLWIPVVLRKPAWIPARWVGDGGFGRAALQPLRSRAGQTPFLLKGGLQPPPEGTAWTSALATMASPPF